MNSADWDEPGDEAHVEAHVEAHTEAQVEAPDTDFATDPETEYGGARYAAEIEQFPWPFTEDAYRYTANVEPGRAVQITAAGSWGADVIHVDEHYVGELKQRAAILHRDPGRCTVLPHMRPAAWDALAFGLQELARSKPLSTQLIVDGDQFQWSNKLNGTEITFRYGDEKTLPMGPLHFLGSQIQEDVVLLDQREGALWTDAGLVTFAADWSLFFNIGMSFMEIHGPVPRNYADGVIPEAEQFIMRLQPNEICRRVNWTASLGRRLDGSLETYSPWGAREESIVAGPLFAETLHLRVEVQHLIRLPNTGAILFLIRTYLLPLAEISTVPAWRGQLVSVLETLPAELVSYKGLLRVRGAIIDYLYSQI